MRLWRTMTTSTRKREKPKALRKATERISSRTWKSKYIHQQYSLLFDIVNLTFCL